MSKRKQKLELTWVGKDERPKLEPRILIEDPELSYHADKRYGDDDIFDNILIQGDNLLALKALENDYRGKVKCIYIDPPFNTGAAFEHYDDGLEHSIWLGLMRDRLEVLQLLLALDGVIIVHIDDNEFAYLKVLMDEVFGRKNFVNSIVVQDSHPSGLKLSAKDKKIIKTKSLMLVYKKSDSLRINPIYKSRDDWDTHFNTYLDINSELLTKRKLAEVLKEQKIIGEKDNTSSRLLMNQSARKFCFDNRDCIFQSTKELPDYARTESLRKEGQVIEYLASSGERQFAFNGRRLSPLSKSIQDVSVSDIPREDFAKLLCDFWDDVDFNNSQNEGGIKFPNAKKPEFLIARILKMFSNFGDLVLDSFGGSGTTAAVAHKMGRRWITIEIGDHAQTHIVPRLKRVIDGDDKSGVTEPTGWKGGGGYRFYRLAPSLLEKDKYHRLVISKKYNPAMLSEAMCKLMGFTYAPSDDEYWNHGYAHDQSHIYVTTNRLTFDYLNKLSHDVGPSRSLLVCCKAFEGQVERLDNLTVTKIPQAVLDQCEWGKDDYSLNVKNLPMAATDQLAKQGNLFGDDAGGDDA